MGFFRENEYFCKFLFRDFWEIFGLMPVFWIWIWVGFFWFFCIRLGIVFLANTFISLDLFLVVFGLPALRVSIFFHLSNAANQKKFEYWELF